MTTKTSYGWMTNCSKCGVDIVLLSANIDTKKHYVCSDCAYAIEREEQMMTTNEPCACCASTTNAYGTKERLGKYKYIKLCVECMKRLSESELRDLCEKLKNEK